MKLLLLSNSTNAGEQYLGYPMQSIKGFFGNDIDEVLFIPYAAVTFSYDKYFEMVSERFKTIGCRINSIHKNDSPLEAIRSAKAIAVGGGNTFKLLREVQANGLLELIREQVIRNAIPYVGWSAGSNLTCPAIFTTNDMPIVEPESFNALNFIPFQINPHYQDKNPEGHAGETREQRILEFIEMNRDKYVVGLREGTILQVEDGSVKLIGNKPARIFKYGQETIELSAKDNFTFLIR